MLDSLRIPLADNLVAGTAMLEAGKLKFCPDDPLTSDPEREDASRVTPREVDHVFGGW